MPSGPMPPGGARGAGLGTLSGSSGVIDYRLARQGVLASFRKGRLAQHEVCDAHPELVRAARAVGTPTDELCPVCEDASLVIVIYVFGPRLPAFGRCVTTRDELARLDRRAEPLTAYVVEVCPGCRWNHLRRSYPMGRPRPARSARSSRS